MEEETCQCSCGECQCGSEDCCCKNEEEEQGEFEAQFGTEKRFIFGPSHSVDTNLKSVDLKIPRKSPLQ